VIGGKPEPEAVNRSGFLELNESVRHYHLNTALGNGILAHCKKQGIDLTPEFIGMLKAHHALER